jgi:hypothetical protein
MILEKAKHFIYSLIMFLRELISPPKDIEHTQIPIIINNFNRLEYLKTLLNGLETRGYTNIYILDNQSNYPPLLEFYKNTTYEVVFLEENYGFRALWKSKLYKKFMGQFFVYTDSDLEIIEECPPNFLEIFRDKLKTNKFASKVGFSLKIDDIPDYYSQKKKVLSWEEKFYKKPTKDKKFYKAPIDTTFALYRPYSFKHIRSPHSEIYRSVPPYTVKHLPWYIDDANLSEENNYYLNTSNQGSTWFKHLKTE